MSLAGGLREFLRPPAHRGPIIAAGSVSLAVGVSVGALRLKTTWPASVNTLILLVTGGLIFWLGVQAHNEEGVPPAYQSVLLATGLPLVYGGVVALSSALGADYDPLSAGGLLWTSAIVGALALWPALERNSAICLFFAEALA